MGIPKSFNSVEEIILNSDYVQSCPEPVMVGVFFLDKDIPTCI